MINKNDDYAENNPVRVPRKKNMRSASNLPRNINIQSNTATSQYSDSKGPRMNIDSIDEYR